MQGSVYGLRLALLGAITHKGTTVIWNQVTAPSNMMPLFCCLDILMEPLTLFFTRITKVIWELILVVE